MEEHDDGNPRSRGAWQDDPVGAGEAIVQPLVLERIRLVPGAFAVELGTVPRVDPDDGQRKASLGFTQLPIRAGLGPKGEAVACPVGGARLGTEDLVELAPAVPRVVLVIAGNCPDRKTQVLVGTKKPLQKVLVPTRRIGDIAIDDHEVGIDGADQRQEPVLRPVPFPGVADNHKPKTVALPFSQQISERHDTVWRIRWAPVMKCVPPYVRAINADFTSGSPEIMYAQPIAGLDPGALGIFDLAHHFKLLVRRMASLASSFAGRAGAASGRAVAEHRSSRGWL